MRGLIVFLSGMAIMLAIGWAGLPKVLYRTENQPLQFNHKVHADKAGMECSGCHELRADGSFSGIPAIGNCAGCHPEPQGTTLAEKTLVKDFVTPNREIPWRVYARQPMNVRFPHATHIKAAKLTCETCHGDHGKSSTLAPYQENRISGYSRNIWGSNLARVNLPPGEGMKMSDCENCHAKNAVSTGCFACHQ